MIISAWKREQRKWWWLIVLGVIVLAEVLFGTWLLTWELRLIDEAW